MPSTLETVWQEIDREMDTAVEALRQLGRIPSITADTGAVERAAAMAAGMLHELGAEVGVEQVAPDYPLVWGRVRGADPSRCLLMYNHIDVVPPGDEDKWRHDPFEPTLESGALYGRGIGDNKGPFVARAAACAAYRRVAGAPPVDLIFLVDGQEEIGSPGLGEFLAQRADRFRADACLWEGSTKDSRGIPTFQMGVKGKHIVEITVLGPRAGLHNKYGVLVKNPVWELAHLLASMRGPDGEPRVAGCAEGVDRFSDEERRALGRMAFDKASLQQDCGLPGVLPELEDGSYWEHLLLRPDIVALDLAGGETLGAARGTLPREARVKLSFSLVPSQSPEHVDECLRRHVAGLPYADRVRIRHLRSVPPYRTPLSAPIAGHVRRAATAVYGCDPIIYPLSPGSGPMSTICGPLGVDTIAVGVSHPGSASHGPNENIRLQDFAEGIRLVAAIWASMAGEAVGV